MTPTQLGELILSFISKLEIEEREEVDSDVYYGGYLHLTVPSSGGRWAIIVKRPTNMDDIQ